MNSTAEVSSPVPTFCRYVATKLDSDWWKNTCKGKIGKWEEGEGKEGGGEEKERGREREGEREGSGEGQRGGKEEEEGRLYVSINIL